MRKTELFTLCAALITNIARVISDGRHDVLLGPLVTGLYLCRYCKARPTVSTTR